MKKAFDLSTIDVSGLAREPEDFAQFVKLDLRAGTERGKFITEIDGVAAIPFEIGAAR